MGPPAPLLRNYDPAQVTSASSSSKWEQYLPSSLLEGKFKGYVHDKALCTGKACADCRQSFTVAACVTTCIVTPL